MENRVAVIGIIVENMESVSALNATLSQYSDYIIGRMGLPYREKGVHIISLVVDAPEGIINTIASKAGRLNGVSAKALYSNV
ncbi:MAG: iron-only hydrogenase system regulator [Clostridiales bacterium]|nr:iron-only hydrogenase system regulator [Clostridiales bacterium]